MKIMRRNDKRITEEAELWQTIDDSPYVVVAFTAGEPYAVPLDFSRLDKSISAIFIRVLCSYPGQTSRQS